MCDCVCAAVDGSSCDPNARFSAEALLNGKLIRAENFSADAKSNSFIIHVCMCVQCMHAMYTYVSYVYYICMYTYTNIYDCVNLGWTLV
jgi:hypothetical protein